MDSDTLLSNRKASRIFFELLCGRARAAGLVSRCGLSRKECDRLLSKMERTGLVVKVKGGSYEIDWERFVPLFISQAMNIYSAAMPFKYVPYYMEKDPDNVIDAACARAERELARVKVKLSGSDLFCRVVQTFFTCLATEIDAPRDYLADLRILDAIDEFEYALLKLLPLVRRRKGINAQARELFKLLSDWYGQIQGYDNTPTGAALRAAFAKNDLL